MSLIDTLLDLYVIVVLIRVFLSWVNVGYNQFTRLIYSVTDPLLVPIRRFVPPFGGIDISPIVLLLGIYIIKGLIH
ncbi:YggT family protein [candidate division KSB1 bacterium]